MFDFTGYDVLGWVVFGGIGMIYCAYGKMKELWQPWVLGVALMVYPYFAGKGVPLWSIGSVLTLLIFFARD